MTAFQNRSFLYGDGLFETMRLHRGKIVFLQEHFERLSAGMKVLQLTTPQGFSPDWLEQTVKDTINEEIKDANSLNWRVRITVYRAAGGLYTPTHSEARWEVIFSPLPDAKFQLNEQGLLIGKYQEVQLSADVLSPLKTTSALPYVMAGLYRKTKYPHWDDCFLVNQNGRVAEAIAANVFLRTGDCIYTPSLAEGCVSGVLRRVLINWCTQQRISIEECALSPQHFEAADEIWLTNVIQGIRWVQKLSFMPGKLYCADWADRVVEGLNDLLYPV